MNTSNTPQTSNEEPDPTVTEETVEVVTTTVQERQKDPSVREDAEAADRIEHQRRPPIYRRASVATTLWLVLVWIAAFSSVSPLTLLSGLVLAILVQVLFPLPLQTHLWHVRPWHLLILVLRFIWDLVVAGSSVASLVISGRDHEDGIVRVDTRSGNPVYMTILAAMSSMVPGTIVIKLDPEDKAMFLHILDLENHGGIQGSKEEAQEQEKRILLALAPNSVLRESGLQTTGTRMWDSMTGRRNK